MNRLRFGILLAVSALLLVSGKFYPALGKDEDRKGQAAVDDAVYTFHSDEQAGEPLPEGTCKGCHPGEHSKNLDSLFTAMEIGCLDCHAGMASMAIPASMQGVASISCSTCHDHNHDPADTNCTGEPIAELSENDSNSFVKAGGDGTSILFCSITSAQSASANPAAGGEAQLVQPFGYLGSIVNCSACHSGSL